MKLVKLETMTIEQAAQVFTSQELDDFLKQIEDEALSFVPDITTDKGRKECASKARAIASQKVKLDDLGKELVAEWKTKSKLVDDSRKKARDFLDSLRDKVREPLTKWENAEKERRETIELLVEDLENLSKSTNFNGIELELTSEDLKVNLKHAKDFNIDEDKLAEYTARAAQTKDRVIRILEAKIEARLKYEAEQEELSRLKKEREEKEERERIEKIKREAAEQARINAENEAAENIRKEREAREKAEREAEAAKNRIEQEKAEAIRQEQLRQAQLEYQKEQAKKAADAEQLKRSQDIEHRRGINRSALADLVGIGLDEETAKNVIIAIADGKIRNITINY